MPESRFLRMSIFLAGLQREKLMAATETRSQQSDAVRCASTNPGGGQKAWAAALRIQAGPTRRNARITLASHHCGRWKLLNIAMRLADADQRLQAVRPLCCNVSTGIGADHQVVRTMWTPARFPLPGRAASLDE